MPPPPVREKPAVCLLIASFHPRVGGGETHARLLARELNALGTPAFVLTRRHERGLAAEDTVDGARVLRVGPPGLPRFGKYAMLLPAVSALFRRRRDYEIIYVCGLRVLGMAGILAGCLLRKRVVLRAEACGELSGAFVFQNAGQAKKGLNPLVRAAVRLRNRAYRRADAYLAISRVIREEFTACGVPPEKIATITNGIDFARFAPPDRETRDRLRAEWGFAEGFVFAYSGKLNRGKGLELLLRVWSRLAPEHPAARLLLIGGGGSQFLSCEEELRAFVARHGLERSVRFTGYTDRVAEHLGTADAFVFPSESEALGLALIEAMACGLPCLASATGGILDIVRDGFNGRLLPAGDEAAWFGALTGLLRDPAQARTWAEAGRASVRERFAIRAVAVQHQQLFASLAPA